MHQPQSAVTDFTQIRHFIQDGHVLNLALNDGTYPYVVPVNYGYIFDSDQTLHLYVHGAPVGQKRDLIAHDPHVAFSIVADQAFEHSANNCTYWFKSVLGTGVATLLTDRSAKELTLQRLIQHEAGDQAHLDLSGKSLDHLGAIRIDVTHLTAKQHQPQS
ncbi:pyridoxamine 5'-phosphate oxidase family protein [Levilactobacillus namurensis]|uniref:pyridoxamine 5'-phosphate oxidase family protein n=1 Tax=Levilactobacillus namurensis TaxID=380393 RepID=UPI0022328EF2|nr:pyridoxamine 5'-phosphate oxidase family protein [Levilactobacillus namurensis]MCW3779493.1 pyridoxamine 5'-phosphate oxidase family protein [Levilactobacillus namurensis]MDT7017686.1 pyridoxamine 5'-phosphate oxidase family protein [Levilactobacillus namurensis]WNN65312.1 pyridoxamine 5'-phosphate oxidase family protein [Levilactobacillus namurensis]